MYQKLPSIQNKLRIISAQEWKDNKCKGSYDGQENEQNSVELWTDS